MCVFELYDKENPDLKLGFDAKIHIGQHLIIRRVPIAEYRNTLKNIIDCFSDKKNIKD